MNIASTRTRSLPEVNSSVQVTGGPRWRRLLAFAGPAYLVSVGYMDPGNWASDLEGGARFGYQLVWVLLLSNLMAILLQALSARLGIAAQLDLAQACGLAYPKPIARSLWFLCEIAIAACDLAEVLGAAIGLNLLFHLPILYGVLLTSLDTLVLLAFSRLGIRLAEGFVLVLVAVIAACFLFELHLVHIDWTALAAGIVPRLDSKSLYVAISILGATVMPHNLYLHSALVQTRQIGETPAAKKAAARFNLVDLVVALNGALIVNASILILAASVFHSRGMIVTEIQQAHQLLAPMLGTGLASVLFAVALICSGQSSTLTGTLAGQVVMEGFLSFRMQPWLRRLVTRLVAIVPAALVITLQGEQSALQLLLFSQVVLSLQLPFAVIPLIHFTSDRTLMGELVNPRWVRWLAWAVAVLIVGLNVWLVGNTIQGWMADATLPRPLLVMILGAAGLALGGLLVWIVVQPLLPAAAKELARPPPWSPRPPSKSLLHLDLSATGASSSHSTTPASTAAPSAKPSPLPASMARASSYSMWKSA